ncbi:MAG: tetratricopeptide repeat protein [Solirubrobacteraceae bacterium]
MGAKFFSHRTPGETRDAGGEVRASDIGLEALDHQQALVLDALRRAACAPVSYAELRDAGVEFPASVVSELELAGVVIQRCVGTGPGAAGVRLDPDSDPAARPAPDPAEPPVPTDKLPETGWSGVRVYRASSLEGLFLRIVGRSSPATSEGDGVERQRTIRRRRAAVAPAAAVRERPVRVNRRRRVPALTAFVGAIAVLLSFVVISGGGSDRRTPVPLARRPHSRVPVGGGGARPASSSRATHPSPPVPVSPALAAELEARGHSLVEAGRYGDSVPVLKRAVLATGETLGACREPASSTCLTYAYALYDLGRAVRLSGEPQAAVPILERRLQIDNQRSIVGAELRLARRGIG